VKIKILFIADYAPPYNRIGAVRVGKTIKFLTKLGFDVRLLTAHHNKEVDLSLPLEIPNGSVIYADSPRFSDIAPYDYSERISIKKIWDRFCFSFRYKNPYFLFREDSLSWIPFAQKIGQQQINLWKPDFIISSALPITAHVIAGRLSRKNKIPWVAEYRDLWLRTEDLNTNNNLNQLHIILERFIIRNASLLVTVSNPLADYLREKHPFKVKTIYSGFDPTYLDDERCKSEDNKKILTIAYTGSLYLIGRSICDPIPLFKAINHLGVNRKHLLINLYTDKNLQLEKIVNDLMVNDVIKIYNRVEYKQSLKIQKAADVLLFLGYSTSVGSQSGILSGKVLEYLGSLKPILSIGRDYDHILCQEGFMDNYNDPESIAKQLNEWIIQKIQNNLIVPKYSLDQINKWSSAHQISLLANELTDLYKANV
jgi:glycosyltransferase involved in cell wall biosynthesis